MNGGRFEFDDGGSYCGGWEEAKAHGHGVCTGPQGKGEYAGAWHYGFEVSGVYTWPSGNTYSGQWQNGKRHGLGTESRGRWVYKGDWTSGSKGRYGVRSSQSSQARYAGTWSANYHDGYGTEVYVDGGLYQGQWLRGMRHGFGVRKSAVHGVAARLRKTHNHVSLTSLRSGQIEMTDDEDETKKGNEGRGGFVLRANSRAPARRRRSLSERSLAMKRTLLSGLRIRKQHSTGDIHQKVSNYTTGSLRSSGSTMSCASDDSHKDNSEPEEEHVDENVTESYCGEWKNDARSGFGVCERSDGLKYHGEWANNMKNGYGVTLLKDGTKEEGKYKNNVLVMSSKKKGVLFVRSSRLRERVEASVEAAARSADIAKQKADIAASRTSTAKERAEQAGHSAHQAKGDSEMARIHAKQFDPNFNQPGTANLRRTAGNSVDSPRTQLSSDHSSRSSKPPSFDQTGDMATDPLAYTNHVTLPQPRLPHQSSTSSSNYLHVNPHGQVSFDESSMAQSPPLSSAPLPNSTHPLPSLSSPVPSVSSAPQDRPPTQVQYPSGYGPGGSQQPQSTHPSGLPPLAPPSRSSIEHHPGQRESVGSLPSSSSAPQPSPLRQTPTTEIQSSRVSLADDHYEQYVVRSRRQKEELNSRAPRELSNGAVGLSRRLTMAGSHDKAPLVAMAAMRSIDQESVDPMGSLPNLAELEDSGVRMMREEAARLASNRRQQVVREEEEREQLRANPLRYLMHPSFRNLLRRYKVPLLLVGVNVGLFLILYYFVSASDRPRREKDPR